MCFGKSDGNDLNGVPLEYDILNNPISCNPSECPAGVGSLSVLLDDYQMYSYEAENMLGQIRIHLNPESSVSNFIFDISGINAVQAGVMKIPAGAPLPLAVEGFDVSTEANLLMTKRKPPAGLSWNIHFASRTEDQTFRDEVSAGLQALQENGQLMSLMRKYDMPRRGLFESTHNPTTFLELR